MRRESCLHSHSSCRQSGRWTRATAAAVAVAAAAVACATAAAVAVAAAAMAAAVWQQPLHAPRQLLPRSQLQLLHAQRQVMSQPWQWSGSYRQSQPSQPRQRPTHPAKFPSERGAVARGEQCARGCFASVPALCCLARRALDATRAASIDVRGAGGGGSEYPTHVADCSGRASAPSASKGHLRWARRRRERGPG
jgi:hypothetical protein